MNDLVQNTKVLLIGKLSHENFGDVLMAVYYARWIIECGATPVFYRVAASVKDRLVAEVDCEFVEDLDCWPFAAGAIFFGGGYFGHGLTNSFSWPKKWMAERYFTSAYEWLIRHEVPYIVSSVEIGPLLGRKVRAAIAEILNRADMVAPRNQASLEFATSVAPDSNLKPGFDVVYEELASKSRVLGSGLILGVHATDKLTIRNRAMKHYYAGLERGIRQSATRIAQVGVVYDSVPTGETREAVDHLSRALDELKIPVVITEYRDLQSTISVLETFTHFVTTKLHAGVVVKAAGGQVLAINDQPKVRRFYRELGQEENVISFYLSSANRIARRMNLLLAVENDGSSSSCPSVARVPHAELTKNWLKGVLEVNA